ncbi:MAG TPA: hypothetical protein VLI40_13425, partial [Gemmatimonadaceae bacterium]|nr:hypothetical protein [Gemmatimonadaceae bacterium]
SRDTNLLHQSNHPRSEVQIIETAAVVVSPEILSQKNDGGNPTWICRRRSRSHNIATTWT